MEAAVEAYSRFMNILLKYVYDVVNFEKGGCHKKVTRLPIA